MIETKTLVEIFKRIRQKSGQHKLNYRETLKRPFFVAALFTHTKFPVFIIHRRNPRLGEYIFPIFIHSPRISADIRLEVANKYQKWSDDCARITRRSDGIGSVDERFSSCFGREFVVHSCAAPLLNRIESKSI